MKSYLVTIKGNDIFVYDFTTEVSSPEELIDKVQAVINNLRKQTIEELHIDSILALTL